MTKRIFEFYKNKDGEWYLNLPQWKGDPADLQMVEGADKWLDLVSNHAESIKIILSDTSFEAAEILTLLRMREDNLGRGGIYYLESYQSQKIGLKIWLCEVTRFVFNQIPQKVYFRVT